MMETLTETHLDSELLARGRILTFQRDTVRLPDGQTATRELVLHPGGVVVLPQLEDGRIVFVEQFRYATGQTLLELPAGKLEPGEDPFDAIQRELQEETGYVAAHWEPCSSIFTAPGFCNERLWLYKATGLFYQPLEDFNPTDHGEFLRTVALTPAEAWSRLRSGGPADAKTLCLLAWCGVVAA